MDKIFVKGFRGMTVIGVRQDELDKPQLLVIDLTAARHRISVCNSAEPGDTIDYGAVHERLLAYLDSHQHRLLEAFAEGIADILLNEFSADWVQVTVVKPRKFSNFESVGVQIERHRTRPLDEPHDGAELLRFLGRGLTAGSRQI